MNELKPCPFCGNDNLDVNGIPYTNKNWVEIYCRNCFGSIRSYTYKDAVMKWNKRTIAIK